MTELGHADAPPTYVLFVGNHERPLDEVQPGFPAAIANGQTPVIVPTATSSGRRTALANWIASPENPLTARVFVNRVWGQYFGRGIVETVSNFGKAGQQADQPRVAGLSGRYLRGAGLEREEAAPRDSAVERLPAVLGTARGRVSRRSGQQAAGGVSADAPRGRRDSGLAACGRRQARRHGRRSERVSAGAEGPERRKPVAGLEGSDGLQPAQPLHLHAAQRGVSDARGVQHGFAAAGPQPADCDDHAAAGAHALQQRPGLRMVAGPGGPGHPRSGQ